MHRPVVLLGLFLALVCASQGRAEVTVVLAGRLLDTDSRRVLERQMIVVRDGVVESVGPSEAVSSAANLPGTTPAGARIIDLSAYTVLPGLIDAHTHLVGDVTSQDPVSELQFTAAQRALQSLPNARAVLLAGFTTVRDVGTFRALVDVALRDAINRGDVVGPRMFVVGAYITITGGAGALSGIAPDIELPWDLRYGNANSPAEVRERVRALAAQGVDAIKVLATGAVLTHNSNPNAREASLAELEAAVEEAQNFGLKVAAHGHGAPGIKNAIRAGVASIEHGTLMDEEGRALMKQHGTYLVPTLEVHECIGAGFPPEFIAKAKRMEAAHFETFRKAVQQGVKIAFGTDISVCPFGRNAREFALMVQNGMTPMQAILSATVAGADLLGVSDRLGSIKPGKFADLIAVRGDPLADVKVLENVRFVMKQGVVYKQE